jgi:AcrR family transcriptional regulator
MRRNLTPRGRERRAQLMDAATALFADRGYHPTAVSDIVDSLGVGKGVFYWYFSSKEELLSKILSDAHLRLRRAQQAALAEEADPVRRIELGILASLEWFRRHREYFAITQFAATDETFAPVLRRNREVAVADTVRHIKEAMVEGRIADGEPELLAHAILGVVDQLTRRYLIERDEPVEQIATAAIAFCISGLTGVTGVTGNGSR